MQRVKSKTLLYLEHDDTCWVYDVTYDYFCSLQQAKVILFTLWIFSSKRHFGKQWRPRWIGASIIRLFIRVCAFFREKHYILEINKTPKADKTLITIKLVLEHFRNIFAKSVGSVWSGSILFAALLKAKLFNGRPRQMICPASIQSRATIGPPAKRRSDGVLLAGR